MPQDVETWGLEGAGTTRPCTRLAGVACMLRASCVWARNLQASIRPDQNIVLLSEQLWVRVFVILLSLWALSSAGVWQAWLQITSSGMMMRC